MRAAIGLVGIAAIAFAMSGCVTVESAPSAIATSSQVQDQNYAVGQVLSASVGDVVIRAKDYTVTTSASSAVEVSEDGVVRGGLATIPLRKGERLPIVGSRYDAGVAYSVVVIQSFGLQVGPDGVIRDRVLNGFGTGVPPVQMVYKFTTIPSDLRLKPVTHVATSAEGTGKNFEIVFNGIDGQAAHFQYREFSAEDMARPAFFQELSYPVGTKIIRFRKLAIEVLAIDAEHISYRVLSDH